MRTPDGRHMTADEIRAHLRAERLGLRQRHLSLKRAQRAIGRELDEIEDRLVVIEHAFGVLGGE